MFRRKRHIHAKDNEWVHVHRDPQRNDSLDIPKVVGMGAGLFILAALVWELVKATWQYLIVAGVIAAIVHFKKKS